MITQWCSLQAVCGIFINELKKARQQLQNVEENQFYWSLFKYL